MRIPNLPKPDALRRRNLTLPTLLCLGALALTGCSGARTLATPATSEQPRKGNVVLVRGLMDVFSLGLDQLTSKLRDAGLNAFAVSHLRHSEVSKQVEAQLARSEDIRPLVIVGHSYGADDAIRVTRELHAKGIEVELLVLIDPTTPPHVPANVQRCFNIYKPNPATDWAPVVRGIAVTAEDPTRTTLINFNLAEHNEDGRFDFLNHFTIDESDAVHAMVRDQILTICPPLQDDALAHWSPEQAGSDNESDHVASPGALGDD